MGGWVGGYVGGYVGGCVGVCVGGGGAGAGSRRRCVWHSVVTWNAGLSHSQSQSLCFSREQEAGTKKTNKDERERRLKSGGSFPEQKGTSCVRGAKIDALGARIQCTCAIFGRTTQARREHGRITCECVSSCTVRDAGLIRESARFCENCIDGSMGATRGCSL